MLNPCSGTAVKTLRINSHLVSTGNTALLCLTHCGSLATGTSSQGQGAVPNQSGSHKRARLRGVVEKRKQVPRETTLRSFLSLHITESEYQTVIPAGVVAGFYNSKPGNWPTPTYGYLLCLIFHFSGVYTYRLLETANKATVIL